VLLIETQAGVTVDFITFKELNQALALTKNPKSNGIT
jgi:hypothetical protein